MKICNECNQKRGGLKKCAFVEENVVKIGNLCSSCRKTKQRFSNIFINVKENQDFKAITESLKLKEKIGCN